MHHKTRKFAFKNGKLKIVNFADPDSLDALLESPGGMANCNINAKNILSFPLNFEFSIENVERTENFP